MPAARIPTRRSDVGRLARLERIVVGLLGHVDLQRVPPPLRFEVEALLTEVNFSNGAVCLHCKEHFDHSETCSLRIPDLAGDDPDPLEPAEPFPVKTELTVLTADPDRPKLPFTVQQFNGCEVFPYDPKDHPGGINWKALHPITTEDGLKEGDAIVTQSIFDHAVILLTVAKDKYGKLFADSEHTMGVLEFGKDSRGCWVCMGLINKRGLSKLDVG